MSGRRHFSQAIAEGDGISVIVHVRDAASARAAEEQGAEGIKLDREAAGVREATDLPILWCADGPLEAAGQVGADACVLVVERLAAEGDLLERLYGEALELGLDCVVDVRDEEELELALERIDPEIFLLSSRRAEEDDEPLNRVLELLPDVPAGKLAIAELERTSREQVVALERAGFDAVIVGAGNVAELVGGFPPEV